MPQRQNAGNRALQIGGNVSRGGVAASGITVVINQLAPQRKASSKGVRPSDVLAAMDDLAKDQRISVLDFMEREFQTRMVVELDGLQLLRTKRYVQAVIGE
jgi:hypothetical protein